MISKWENCIAEIRAAAGASGEKLRDREIEVMLERVMRESSRRSGIRAATPDSLRAAAAELANRDLINAANKKREAAINFANRVSRRERHGNAPDPYLGIQAGIRGINTPTDGSRFSVHAEWKEIADKQFINPMRNELMDAGLSRAAQKPEIEDLWVQELFELSKGKDGTPGITNSPEALQIAEIIHKYQNLAKEQMNRAGAWISDYIGYVTRTQHNVDRMQWAAGGGWGRKGAEARDRNAWKDVIRPLLDDRTYDPLAGRADDVEARETFLDHIYNALISGVHLTHEGMQGYKDPAFGGAGNLAEKLSAERVLHFKGGKEWHAYQKQFGNPGPLIESIVQNLDRSARSLALMRHYGTNPRAEFDADIKYWSETVRDKDPVLAQKISAGGGQGGRLSKEFDALDGTSDIPVNRLAAKIGASVRSWQNMSKLGFAGVNDIAGIFVHASELKYQGEGLLEGYGNALRSIAEGPRGRSAERRQVLDRLQAGFEGTMHEISSPFEPNELTARHAVPIAEHVLRRDRHQLRQRRLARRPGI